MKNLLTRFEEKAPEIVFEVVSMDGHRVDQARVIRPRREEETS